MTKSVEEARKRLDDEYGQVRRHLDSIHDAFDQVVSANAEDDVYERLDKLGKVVKEVRDGGVVGSGANGHRRALEEYREALEAEKKGALHRCARLQGAQEGRRRATSEPAKPARRAMRSERGARR